MALSDPKDRKKFSWVLQNTSREGEYEVECYLSRGSFGEVYRIRRLLDDKLYALKVFQKSKRSDPECRKYEIMFRREAEVLRILKFPQVVGYHDFCESSDCIYIILEYCAGGDLNQYHESFKQAENRKLNEEEVSIVTAAVLKGLRYLHSKMSIIHRDIKPGNILVRKQPGVPLTPEDVCISDFGLCAMFSSPLIQTSNLKCGTDCYNSPEQLKGESYDTVTSLLNQSVDMFALSLTAFQLLKGRHPFRNADGWNPQMQKEADWSDKLEDMSPEAKDFILRSGARRSVQRLHVVMALIHPFITRAKLLVPIMKEYRSSDLEIQISRPPSQASDDGEFIKGQLKTVLKVAL